MSNNKSPNQRYALRIIDHRQISIRIVLCWVPKEKIDDIQKNKKAETSSNLAGNQEFRILCKILLSKISQGFSVFIRD
jgi:hypothetical protein